MKTLYVVLALGVLILSACGGTATSTQQGIDPTPLETLEGGSAASAVPESTATAIPVTPTEPIPTAIPLPEAKLGKEALMDPVEVDIDDLRSYLDEKLAPAVEIYLQSNPQYWNIGSINYPQKYDHVPAETSRIELNSAREGEDLNHKKPDVVLSKTIVHTQQGDLVMWTVPVEMVFEGSQRVILNILVSQHAAEVIANRAGHPERFMVWDPDHVTDELKNDLVGELSMDLYSNPEVYDPALYQEVVSDTGGESLFLEQMDEFQLVFRSYWFSDLTPEEVELVNRTPFFASYFYNGRE